jgi:hypothetical protein
MAPGMMIGRGNGRDQFGAGNGLAPLRNTQQNYRQM